MKLSHLPAALYGLSSSTMTTTRTCSAFGIHRWRGFQRRTTISGLTAIKATKTPQHAFCFRSFHHNQHNRGGNSNRCRNFHTNLFPFASTDDNRTFPYRITQQHCHLQQQRRRGKMALSGTTSNHGQTGVDTTNTGDATTRTAGGATTSPRDPDTAPNETSSVASAETRRSKSLAVPTFRMFYNDVYEVKLPPKHRFPMGKYRKVRERVQNKIADLPRDIHESVDCDFQVSPLSTFEELSTTHDPTYIRRFLEGDQTELEQRNVGFPWSPSGVNRALSSVGGTLAAACFVCDQQRKRQQQQWHRRSESSSKDNETIRHEEASSSIPPPIWAAHIAGGTHHAFYDYGEGFSVFSDMAVAANVILDRYPDVIKNNILLLDVDVHQGNGNAVLFQSQKKTQNQSKSGSNDDQDVKKKKNNDKYSDRVFTFSMHCSGNYFSQKQESDLDIELPIGCQDQAYLMTLNHWLKRFRAEHRKAGGNVDGSVTRGKQHYRWDLIFFQAGVDVLDDDRLGRMALSPEGVAKRNELVYEFASDLGVPLVICMGGGYPKRDDAWESILGAHSDVYFGAHSFLSRWSEDEKS